MVHDFNKKISKIEYNLLNLLSKLQFSERHLAEYGYDAEGKKLSVTYTTSKTNLMVPMGSIVPPQATNVAMTLKTDYCGNMIYENGKLSKILTDVGYITLNSGGEPPMYHYFLTDHLGNNRVVVQENGAVEQINHYYAFGGLMGDSSGGYVQPYKYNGKELDRMHGLDWYDYGKYRPRSRFRRRSHTLRHVRPSFGKKGELAAHRLRYHRPYCWLYCCRFTGPLFFKSGGSRTVVLHASFCFSKFQIAVIECAFFLRLSFYLHHLY